MSRILSTGLAMASLLFAACGTPDDGAMKTEGASLQNDDVAAQPGEACGGLRGNQSDCGKGLYCAYPIALQCGAGDQQGVCTVLPDFCPHGIRYEPVCGCDGNTYDGGCNAALAGTSVQRVGSCDQNITGNWVYNNVMQYSYMFDPAGTFKRSVSPVCLPDMPCPLYIRESEGSYLLQGRMLNLVYTSAADQGQTGQLTIEGEEPTDHLKGSDSGVAVDLVRAR